MYIAPGRDRQPNGYKNFMTTYIASFKMLCSKSDFIHILMILYMYLAPEQGYTIPWEQTFETIESPYHFAHSLQVKKKKKKKSDFIHIFNYFIYVYSPGARADNPLGTNF